MKKIILTTLMLLAALQLVAQIDCLRENPLLQTVTDSTISKPPRQKREKVVYPITLFSQIAFGREGNVSILLESKHNDSQSFCFLNDKAVIRQISDAYTDVEVIHTDCHSAYENLSIIENYTTTYHYSYHPSCNLLSTECGPIKFDSKPITDHCIDVDIQQKSEYFSTKGQLRSRVIELKHEEELLFFRDKNNFVTGSLVFLYHDEKNLINKIEQDSFYRKAALEQYSNNTILDDTGKIIQRVLDKDDAILNIDISNWKRAESPNSYLLTVDYTEEDFPARLHSFEIVSKSETYVLEYVGIVF